MHITISIVFGTKKTIWCHLMSRAPIDPANSQKYCWQMRTKLFLSRLVIAITDLGLKMYCLCQTTAMRQYYIFDIIKVHKNNLFWCFLSADSTLHAHISNISQTVRRVATSMIIFTCIKFLKFPLCHNEACKIGMSSATTISSISRRSLCLELFF